MATKPTVTEGPLTIHELLRLTSSERDRIFSEAAALAEEDYRTNKELTDFETFGEDDLHGESTAAPPE